jgi:uncharacterized protein YhbP (UPF0306 family)
MNENHSAIARFINEHHVMTLAVSTRDQPYCFNAFYVYLESDNSLVFTSDHSTRHIQEALANPLVAGSIVLETELVGKIQGLQFTGLISQLSGIMSKGRLAYLKRFPYAALSLSTLWTVKLNYAKLTDNRLGFGKKLIWTQ